MRNKKTLKTLTTIGCLLVGGVALSVFGGVYNRFELATGDGTFSLKLNESNSVSAAGTTTIRSLNGGEVRFTYTNIAAPTSGNHTKILENGTIVNKDIIHSISDFKAVFTGKLQARIGYLTTNWGDYFDLVSGQILEFGSLPYYLEMKAVEGAVDLESASFGYTCQINEVAEVQDMSGTYDITFSAEGNNPTSSELNASTILSNYVSSGSNYVSSFSATKVFSSLDTTNTDDYGLKVGSRNNAGSLTINLNSTSVKEKITSIDIESSKYGSDSGTFNVSAGGQNISIDPQSGGTLSLNTPQTLSQITIATSSKRAYLSGITLNYGNEVTPETPVDVVGFTATDSNKNKYNVDSIFDNDNSLSVKLLKSDGSHTSLPQGGLDGYTYKVTNSSDVEIDTSKKFGNVGTYTLTVSYKDYIPVVIDLNVDDNVYYVDITPSMTTATFTTADKLSEHLVGNLSAMVTDSNGETEEITYSNFAFNDIGVKLLTPKGITYEQDLPFGTAGNWTVKVYSLDDENIYGDFDITVNAIPVETITLNETSYELHPSGTLQLTTTVGPNNATNPNVYWSSNNEEVATVSDSGLVTAVAVGGAKITATAADGSGVIAQCSITVVAQSTSTPYIVTFNESGSDSPNALSTSDYSTAIATGSDYISSASNTDKTYCGQYGLKFGSSKAAGYITFNIDSSNVKDAISSISFETRQYGSVAGELKCYVNGDDTVSAIAVETDSAELELGGITVTSVTFESSYRIYLTSFSLNRGSSQQIEPVYPTSIDVTGNQSISIGGTSQLSVTYTPNDTNVKNVTFTSSNNSIATVSSEGLVTGITAGTATITTTAEAANSTTVTDTIQITVNAISVSSVSLNQQSASVKAGKTITLMPTILPTNATNKNVTWSTSNGSIASVSNGVVTGVAAGTATITVRTQDGNRTANCVVTVTAASVSAEWELVTDASTLAAGDVLVITDKYEGKVAGDLSNKVLGEVSSTFSNDTITDLSEDALILTLGGSEDEWTLSNDNGQLLGATAAKQLAWDSGTTTWSISISNGNATIQNNTDSYGRFLHNSSSPRFTTYTSGTTGTMMLPQLFRGGTAEPLDPTSILLSNNAVELAPGANKSISVSYVPKNANQNKEITWSSSNEYVATVSGGKITVDQDAEVGQTATITATLTNIPSIHASCTITVVEQQLDDQTIMIYMCGADLESKSGLASGDIQEILKVNGQPDDVNIIIETGGASSWASTYGISSTNLERYHVENKSLVRDESLTYANMGLTSTFQSFLQWGLTNYPAERTGVILWNHGGGMMGVCYDEKKNDDSLLNSEVKAAVANAFTQTGRSTNDKLEWIGYDACLMSVQDIAEFNSQYFNYQISSEESEAGYGWDYDNWIDNAYSKQSTTAILKEICDTFIKDNGGASSSSGDQTLSYLDLSVMAAYKTAWENFAAQLMTKLTNNNKSTFNSAITTYVKHYADSDYDYFCTFDAKDFINKMVSHNSFSSFRVDSSYTTAVLTALNNLVAYNLAQKGAGESYGVCMYWPNSTQYSDVSTYYATSETNFTTWRNLCVTYGKHA